MSPNPSESPFIIKHMDNPSLFQGSKEKFILLEFSDSSEVPKTDFYEEYSKLYISNLLLSAKIKELNEDKAQLEHQLRCTNPKPKRVRRKAREILRFYLCETCGKHYGSEASLRYHCKLKHQMF